MNGVRSISMRKGYLLTALAAAVLLAASSGTALAQVTITGPAMDTVNEGDTATYAVNVKGFIRPMVRPAIVYRDLEQSFARHH